MVLWLVGLGQFLDLLEALQFLGEELDVEVHVLIDQLLLLGEHLHPCLLCGLLTTLNGLLWFGDLIVRGLGGVLDDLFGVEGFGRGDF